MLRYVLARVGADVMVQSRAKLVSPGRRRPAGKLHHDPLPRLLLLREPAGCLAVRVLACEPFALGEGLFSRHELSDPEELFVELESVFDSFLESELELSGLELEPSDLLSAAAAFLFFP